MTASSLGVAILKTFITKSKAFGYSKVSSGIMSKKSVLPVELSMSSIQLEYSFVALSEGSSYKRSYGIYSPFLFFCTSTTPNFKFFSIVLGYQRHLPSFSASSMGKISMSVSLTLNIETSLEVGL